MYIYSPRAGPALSLSAQASFNWNRCHLKYNFFPSFRAVMYLISSVYVSPRRFMTLHAFTCYTLVHLHGFSDSTEKKIDS